VYGIRGNESTPALHDQLEHPVEVRLEPDRAGYGRRGLEAAHGVLELGAPAGDVFVQTRVSDRERRPLGQHDGGLLVAFVEVLSRGLVGEIEVPPLDRNAEERGHGAGARREAACVGVLRHVRKAQGLRVPNQLPEHAAPARQRTDAATGLLVHPA
jgi:hypothetical protein